MKKLNLSIAFALGILVPFSAMADEDVTIRVMEMNEKASDAVMKMVVLPEAASDKALSGVDKANKNREMAREHMNENPGEGVDENEGYVNEHANENAFEHEGEQQHEGDNGQSDEEHGQNNRNG